MSKPNFEQQKLGTKDTSIEQAEEGARRHQERALGRLQHFVHSVPQNEAMLSHPQIGSKARQESLLEMQNGHLTVTPLPALMQTLEQKNPMVQVAEKTKTPTIDDFNGGPKLKRPRRDVPIEPDPQPLDGTLHFPEDEAS